MGDVGDDTAGCLWGRVMPAPTHECGDPVALVQVTDLVVDLLGIDDRQLGTATTLGDVGLDSELAVAELAAEVFDELGERAGVAIELDWERITAASSFHSFVAEIAASLGISRR